LEVEGLSAAVRSSAKSARPRRSCARRSTGVVASSRVVAGQVVAAQDILFQIVDPKSMFVEASSSTKATCRRSD
jgi:multidrug resistance efflux pump